MVASVVAGAGSVAADYVIGQIDALSSVNTDYINGGKMCIRIFRNRNGFFFLGSKKTKHKISSFSQM